MCRMEELPDFLSAINHFQDEAFFQVMYLRRDDRIDVRYAAVDDFVNVAISSIIDTDDDFPWVGWREGVRNAQDLPEFLATAVLTLSPDEVVQYFPKISQNFWNYGTGGGAVFPRIGSVHAVRQMAHLVDLAGWMKHIAVSRTQPTSVLTHHDDSRSNAHVADVYREGPPECRVAALLYALARHRVGCPPDDYFWNKGFPLCRIEMACGELLRGAPWGPDNRPSEDAVPYDTFHAMDTISQHYAPIICGIDHLDGFRKVCPVIVQADPISAAEASKLVAASERSHGKALGSRTGASFFEISADMTGVDFNVSFRTQSGARTGFSRLLDLFSGGTADSRRDAMRWFPCDKGIVVSMPTEIADSMRLGGALFSTFVFEIPLHVGHPLFRHLTLARMFIYGSDEEYRWAVTTMYFLRTSDPAQILGGLCEFDAESIAYGRQMCTAVLKLLLEDPKRSPDTVPFDETELDAVVDIFLAIALSHRMEKVDCVPHEYRIHQAWEFIANAEDAPAPTADLALKCTATLRLVFDKFVRGIVTKAHLLEVVQHIGVVALANPSARFNVRQNPLPLQAMAALSSSDYWINDSKEKAPFGMGEGAIVTSFLVAEAKHIGMPAKDLWVFQRANLGRVGGAYLHGITFPVYRTHDVDMEGIVYDEHLFMFNRVGDFLDPIVDPEVVSKFYAETGHSLRRMHPSPWYGTDPRFLEAVHTGVRLLPEGDLVAPRPDGFISDSSYMGDFHWNVYESARDHCFVDIPGGETSRKRRLARA